MQISGICSICGGHAKRAFTCELCGAVCCSRCFDTDLCLCIRCAAQTRKDI